MKDSGRLGRLPSDVLVQVSSWDILHGHYKILHGHYKNAQFFHYIPPNLTRDRKLPESSLKHSKIIFYTLRVLEPWWILFSNCSTVKHLFLAALPASAYNTYPAKNHAKLRHRGYCSIMCPVCQPSSYTMRAFLYTQQTKQLIFQPGTDSAVDWHFANFLVLKLFTQGRPP